MLISGKEIRVSGRAVRMGRLDGEKFRFLEEPEQVIAALRKTRTRIDLFTFIPRLSESIPTYAYPKEMDNFAAITLTTFDEWWNKQLGFKARHQRIDR